VCVCLANQLLHSPIRINAREQLRHPLLHCNAAKRALLKVLCVSIVDLGWEMGGLHVYQSSKFLISMQGLRGCNVSFEF